MFKSESLKKSGLFFENDKGYFDRFRSRLIFPINNRNGETIGFAGRIILKNDNIAKYINATFETFFWIWVGANWFFSISYFLIVIYYLKSRLDKSSTVIQPSP